MSDRDFYYLREMIRRMQRRIDQLEKSLQEKSVTT